MIVHASGGTLPYDPTRTDNPLGLRWPTIDALHTEALPLLRGIQDRGDTPLLNWWYGHHDDGPHSATYHVRMANINHKHTDALDGIVIELARRGPIILMVGSEDVGMCLRFHRPWWRDLHAEGVRICFDAAANKPCTHPVAREMRWLDWKSGHAPLGDCWSCESPMLEAVHADTTDPLYEWQADYEAVCTEQYLTGRDGKLLAPNVLEDRITRIINAPNTVHVLDNPKNPALDPDRLAKISEMHPHVKAGGWA